MSETLNTLLIFLIIFTCGCGGTQNSAEKSTDVDSENLQSDESSEVEPSTKRPISKLDIPTLMGNLPDSYPDTEYVELPAVGLRLVAPAGFVRAERFHGFEHKEKNAWLEITTSPVSFPQWTSEYIQTVVKDARQTTKTNHFENVVVDGQEGAYLYVVHDQKKPDEGFFGKHVLAFGDETRSWFVNAIYPHESESELGTELFKTAMSIQCIDGSEIGSGADVPFTLESPTLVLTPGWAKTLVFSREGIFPPERATDPFFKALASKDKIQVAKSERAKFARQKISPSRDIAVEQIFIERDIEVDGLPGIELMALAHDHSTDIPILLYAAVLFDEESYVVMYGWAGQFVEEDWGTEFKAITRSFKRK